MVDWSVVLESCGWFMAILIPAYGSCAQRMTSGERRFAQRLEDKLEDDYLLWYDVPIGRKRLHPDFVVLHAWRGVTVLEVKDWKLDTIRQMDRATATILTPDGIKETKNPLRQARDYALAIVKLLEGDSLRDGRAERLLVQHEGTHQGKLAFPYSYGVVLTNITRKQFEGAGLDDLLEPNLVICQDEFYESVDPLEFQQRPWNLCTYDFGEPLTRAQIDRVRWHLFPQIRIGDQLVLGLDEPADESTDEPEVSTIPDLIRVMDLQQEQLARSMGDGHRVIHGVAGSGKTLVLVYRCLHLAQTLTKPILVLCFNVSLAARLRELLHSQGVGDRVVIRHFHRWCGDLLRQHRIALPSYNQFRGEAYASELVQRVVQGMEAGKIPDGQYGAVLIDEGHDFRPEWLKLAVQMVDPATNALLLLYDDAQGLYERSQRRQFSFKSVGIQAQGRTTILKVNYRNTDEVLKVAYAFARELLTPTGDSRDEDEPMLVEPITAGRRGAMPELVKLPSFRAEVDYLVERVQRCHERGVPWNQIGVLYRAHWMAEKVSSRFEREGIPVEWVNRDSTSRNYDPSAVSIKLVTMHSSKGLEFPVVFIPGVGYLPNEHQATEDVARLLYVAMTRAIDQLVMTCDRPSGFVRRLEKVLVKTV